MKETNIMRLIQLDTASAGATLWRNNCGQYISTQGVPIRYGVGNPGGSDLIGVTPVTITPDMVGCTVGVFTAIEVKTKTGRIRPSQKTFINAVIESGGLAGVCRSPAEALELIQSYKPKK